MVLHKKVREYKRKIGSDHGYPVIRVPIKLFRKLGLRINQEVIVEKADTNPFTWELHIKPANATVRKRSI